MKLIQAMGGDGPDKLLAGFAIEDSVRGRDNRVSMVRIWLSETIDDAARYCLELDRGDAMQLRDFLNDAFPETEFYESAENRKTDILNRESLERAAEITPAMQGQLAWKSGEYAYCVHLCQTADNAVVPSPSVKDYLFLQSCLADRAGKMSISIALWGAAEFLEEYPGRFSKAFVWLVEQREKIALEDSGS